MSLQSDSADSALYSCSSAACVGCVTVSAPDKARNHHDPYPKPNISQHNRSHAVKWRSEVQSSKVIEITLRVVKMSSYQQL